MNASSGNLSLFGNDVRDSHNKFNDDTILLVLKILVYGVTPGVCLFGIIGNIFSIMVLKRNGLHKSSNILLVSLAVSDLSFLIAFNNVPKALYDIKGDGRFLYSERISYLLYIVHKVLTIIDYGMAIVGLTIPALITVERFIAVYFPLKMTSIVTPGRTWAIVLFLGVYEIGVMVYSCFWTEFAYRFDEKYNRSVGLIVKSYLFYKDRDFRLVMDQIHMGVKIQPLLTLVGCILIVVKVKMASTKRKKLAGSSKKQNVSKTTQTLIAVCVVYLISCAFLALPSVLPDDILHFTLTSNESTYMSQVMYQIMNVIVCFNGSWNFLIYIVLNKNFRDTFRAILSDWGCTSCANRE